MSYSIFDHDTGYYLCPGRNSKTKSDCMYAYLHYRSEDLGEWWECEDIAPKTYAHIKKLSDISFNKDYHSLFDMFVKEVIDNEKGVEFILQDISCCNFSIDKISGYLTD